MKRLRKSCFTTFITTLFLVLVCLSISSDFASSQVFYDDFNSGQLNSSIWTTDISGVVGDVGVRNERLEFTIPPDSVQTSSLTTLISCTSKFLIRGNFDIQVEYSLLNGTCFDNGGIGLAMVDYGGLYRYNHGTRDVYGYGLESETTDTSGLFRLVRQGDITTGYYYQDGWVWIGSGNNTTGDVAVSFQYRNLFDAQINSPVYVAIDNFVINEGTIIEPVPEPSSLLALAGGLTGIGGMVIRKRRF